MKTILLLLILFPVAAFAQHDYLIYLKDKNGANYVAFSERSLERRAVNNVKFDDKDLEVSPVYLDSLKQIGIVKGASRWMNTVRLISDLSSAELKSRFAFIRDIHEIRKFPSTIQKEEQIVDLAKSINYNMADTQIRQIGIDCLHNDGYTGSGVYFAVIDAGFKGMDTVLYFDSTFMNARVLDQLDFVNGTGVFDYSNHGTAVSSCIFSYRQTGGLDDISGGAPMVDVALYVTEDVFSETLAEEFNLVQALERCDVQGVQVVNISLGYTEFDDPMENHSFSDLDGNTTIAAQGVNTAATKGIVVVAAAGNSGPNMISTPCDADSCLCIGAVDNQGNYAPFSSVGPNADNQVKPDVAATGWNTWIVSDSELIVQGSGTSFASPMLAGGVACLIQAHPTMSVYQIIQAVRESGSQCATPNNYLGYGIADFCEAHQFLTDQSLNLEELTEELVIYPNPVQGELSVEGVSPGEQIIIADVLGRIVSVVNLPVSKSLDVSQLEAGRYMLKIGQRSVSFVKQ